MAISRKPRRHLRDFSYRHGRLRPHSGPNDGFRSSATQARVRPAAASVDLRFGNCERRYSARKRGWPQAHERQPPEMAQIFTDCGYDAMTIAN